MNKLYILLTGLLFFSFCTSKPDNNMDLLISKNIKLSINEDSLRSFLSISDIHLDNSATGIYKTKHGWTDTDQKLWKFTKNKLEELISKKDSLKIDFIVFTGDLPAHGWDNNTRADNMGVVLSFLSDLADEANIPLLFVPGNNDSLDGDYKSFRNTKDQAPFVVDTISSTKWPFVGNKGSCDSSTLTSCYIDSSEVYGYYSAYPLSNTDLRFIGLNTVINNNNDNPSLCYNPPSDGVAQAPAAREQMHWFKKQVQDAASKDEKILIAMHIPPGLDGHTGDSTWANFEVDTITKSTILNSFIETVSKYDENIIGVLTGHTHMDEIRMIFDKSSVFRELCISTPGITPQHNNNPGFKLFSYDPKSYQLFNFETYFAEFVSTGKVHQFKQSYTFNHAYGKPNNRSMEDHIDTLLVQNLRDSIKNGMQKTYRVGMYHHLSFYQKNSMYMHENPTFKSYKTSKCK